MRAIGKMVMYFGENERCLTNEGEDLLLYARMQSIYVIYDILRLHRSLIGVSLTIPKQRQVKSKVILGCAYFHLSVLFNHNLYHTIYSLSFQPYFYQD